MGVTYYPNREVTRIQFNHHSVVGVSYSDGTMSHADGYVSALPYQSLLSCLPERLLAKYSYFCSLANLKQTPALIVQLEFALRTHRPRLVLSSQPFKLIVSRPEQEAKKRRTVFSCVVRGNQDILEAQDSQILEHALASVHARYGHKIPHRNETTPYIANCAGNSRPPISTSKSNSPTVPFSKAPSQTCFSLALDRHRTSSFSRRQYSQRTSVCPIDRQFHTFKKR